MIIANNVSKQFGSLKALNNFSVNCNKGECIALIGPNGSGKTTFAGKAKNKTIPQEHKPFSAEKAFVYLFLIGLPQGTITVPTIPFTNEENRNVQESICHLRNARKVLAEAMELFHGGIMIDKPKEFKLNGANKKTSKENIEI